MTLPAHRFRDREDRKKGDGAKTWVFDFDESITAAPEVLARLATAVRAMGDRVVVLTGNTSPRGDLKRRLTDDYKFPFDDLIQYTDNGSDGLARSKYLEQLDAFCGIDDRSARGPTYVKVCPQLFVMAAPTDENKDDAKGAKKAAKKAVKKVGRSEQRGAATPPPNLRESTSAESDQPEHECGTCRMYDEGVCWGYGLLPVDGEWVCDSWALDPNWQDQDAAQDAADSRSVIDLAIERAIENDRRWER